MTRAAPVAESSAGAPGSGARRRNELRRDDRCAKSQHRRSLLIALRNLSHRAIAGDEVLFLGTAQNRCTIKSTLTARQRLTGKAELNDMLP
jgi:hypothetical protein